MSDENDVSAADTVSKTEETEESPAAAGDEAKARKSAKRPRKKSPKGRDADTGEGSDTAPEGDREPRANRKQPDDADAKVEKPAPKRAEGDSFKDEGGDEGGSRRGGRGRRGGGRSRKTSSAPRREPIQVDAKELAKKAWQLYRADIAEEGIALVKDDDGRKLVSRSFDLARLFLEERARRAPKTD